MKRIITVLMVINQIYTSVVNVVNNMKVIIESVQSVLVRVKGASVTSRGYGSFE